MGVLTQKGVAEVTFVVDEMQVHISVSYLYEMKQVQYLAVDILRHGFVGPPAAMARVTYFLDPTNKDLTGVGVILVRCRLQKELSISAFKFV